MSQEESQNTGSDSKQDAIGFPAPLLGARNLRLPVLYNKDGLIAIEKPPYILSGPHPWFGKMSVLSDAVNSQLLNEKPELLRLGLNKDEPLQAIFHIDPEIAGVALFACGSDAISKARNEFGSNQMELHFTVVAYGGPSEDEVVCDLPVARHRQLPKALISHKTGKKTTTVFRRIENIGRYNVWEATSNYYRADQLPLHCSEMRIRILGEERYCNESPMYLSSLKRGWEGDREEEQPLYEAPAAWLSKIVLPNGDVIEAAPPARLANLIKQLRRFCTR